MKAAIVGAGAIGTFIGTRLVRSGHEVAALARGRTAVALAAHGFRFQQGGERLDAPVRVSEEAVGGDSMTLTILQSRLAGADPAIER